MRFGVAALSGQVEQRVLLSAPRQVNVQPLIECEASGATVADLVHHFARDRVLRAMVAAAAACAAKSGVQTRGHLWLANLGLC
jgi:hypothetical protein